MWPHITSFGAIMAFACLYGWFGSCASARPPPVFDFGPAHLSQLTSRTQGSRLSLHLVARRFLAQRASQPVRSAVTSPARSPLTSRPGRLRRRLVSTVVGFGVLCNAPGQFLGGSIAGWTLDAAGGRYGTVGYCASTRRCAPWSSECSPRASTDGLSRAPCADSGSVMLAGAVTLLPARWMGRRELWAKY